MLRNYGVKNKKVTNASAIDENPGFQLRELLMRWYPPPVKAATFSAVDQSMNADGLLVSLLYQSAINYMLRRLVSGAAYFRKQCDRDGLSEEEFNRQLRHFLKNSFSLPASGVEKIFVLLKECVVLRDRSPSARTMTIVRKSAARHGVPRCYMCGREVTFSAPAQEDSGEVEHIWPRDMGGLSDESNLKIACHRCNQSKGSRVDYSDFHYEAICLTTSQEDEHFLNEFRHEYRLAALARSDFRCVVCERAAEQAGVLEFCRSDKDDAWHFLNINVTCDLHKGGNYGDD